MDKIPLEVLTKITSYLRCSEKLELLRVCRYWHDAIKYTNLYNDFSVRGHNRFEQALASFKDQPDLITRQVEKIQLVKPETDLLTILHLPAQFPNLEEFTWEDYLNEDFSETPLSSDMDKVMSHWKKLKSITETNRYLYLPTLLRSGTFPHLTQLKVYLHFAVVDIGDDIISRLNQAPMLNLLELYHIGLNVQRLETLHEKTPNLETLILLDVVQTASDFDFRYEGEQRQAVERTIFIKPAPKIHTLTIHRISLAGAVYGVEKRWLMYISQKYTNMINFTINGVGMGSNPKPYYESALKMIAVGCPKIERYKIKIFPLTSEILNAMDTSGIQLKELDIVSGEAADDQLLDLSNSQQKDYIQSLRVQSFSGGNNIFKAVEQFPQLKSLDVRSTATITLNTSLKKLKNLESLSLSSCDLCLDTNDQEIVELKLQALHLEKVMIINAVPALREEDEEDPCRSIDVFNYMSQSCPYLSTLSIQGQVSDTSCGPFKAYFPQQYFRSIKVYILGNTYYKVDNERQITWYKFRGKNLQETIKGDTDEFNNIFHVSVLYKGLTSFNIGGTIIPNW